MKNLRRLVFTAVAMTALSGVASADTVISYTVTLNPTVTDLTNQLLQLTAWNPGGTGALTNVASDSMLPALMTHGPTLTAGVTMASLNQSGVTYTLQGYDIFVAPTITGTFNVTDTSGSVSGTANVTSYTAISLGSTMSALTTSSDPSNDLFIKNSTSVPGYGADSASNNINVNLTTGQSTGNQPITGGAAGADYGFYYEQGPANGQRYNLITPANSDPAVSVTSSTPLNFYVSSLTNVTTSINGGSVSTAKSTSIAEAVTIFYDYTTSGTATPEPATMVLFGSALVGLGLLRKRARQA